MNLIELTRKAASDIQLPKWPQALTTGPDVTVDQAKEIIFRTDELFTRMSSGGGNNHRWLSWARTQLGYDLIEQMRPHEGEDWAPSYHRRGEVYDEVSAHMGYLDTTYVHNTWGSSCFVYGPYGFCSPGGKINFLDNIGKWPSVDDVVEDLEAIAQAFPFLDMWMTLVEHEYNYEDDHSIVALQPKPLITFHVKDGIVTIYAPTMEPHALMIKTHRDNNEFTNYSDSKREQGLPDKWIIEMGKKTRPFIKRLLQQRGVKTATKSRAQREGVYIGKHGGKQWRTHNPIRMFKQIVGHTQYYFHIERKKRGY